MEASRAARPPSALSRPAVAFRSFLPPTGSSLMMVINGYHSDIVWSETLGAVAHSQLRQPDELIING
jgi:hypothetical protein